MRQFRWVVLAVLGWGALSPFGQCEPVALPRLDPQTVGLHPARLAIIDQIVQEGVRDQRMPGAVVLVGFRGGIVYRKAFGNLQLEPTPEPMTIDTVFDLASLTKPIATATSVMQLCEQGRITLDAPVSRYLPAFASHGKETITVQHLLTHQGGLIADNSIQDYAAGETQAIERIMDLTPLAAPGERFIYSDVGFIVLGELVASVSGQPLDQYTREAIFTPLGMRETMYRPTALPCDRFAPTEQRDGQWLRGTVHDPRAHALSGVAGHAGLFSTADDLARYAQALLNGGEWGGQRILKSQTVERMTAPQTTPGGIRGLGWDMRTGYSSNRGDLFSARACGHGGFTGTGLWFDPELQMFVIFLSNRVHPHGEGNVNPLIGRIGTIAAAAIRE
ncbi:MAG: class A beta-lactamase-related serine hydrolase [Planctomycetota bacterium]|nr:MAG: class A beta-lactamase-related serine hydrolase [Planctomycetota bacterium]